MTINAVPEPLVTTSTPDPAWTTLMFGVLRHILSALGAMGILDGWTISDSNLMIVAGSVVWIIAAVWSWQNKKSLKEKDNIGSVLSAKLQRPVQPI